MNQRLLSSRFPYVPLTLIIDQVATHIEALLDTGFDGDIIVPRHFSAIAGAPAHYIRLTLADGSTVVRPVFPGTVELGPLGTFPVEVASLGDEYLIGRKLTDRFTVILDHGRQLFIEP